VLSRLTHLSHEVEQIGASGDPSARLQVAGQDEISNLSTEINRMLAALEQRLAERRNLLNAIPDLLFVFNQDGDCLEFKIDQGNRQNLEGVEMVGRNIRQFGFSTQALGTRQRCYSSGGSQPDHKTFELITRQIEKLISLICASYRSIRMRSWPSPDITDHKRSEEALRESEERFSLAVAGAKDGIWDWDLRDNKIYFSLLKSMLGYAENDLNGEPQGWFDLIHPEDLDQFQKGLDAHLDGLTNHLESELRVMHKDGGYRWMLYRGLAVRHNGTKPTRLAGSQTDVTDRKYIEQQLQHKALHDELTNLPNRTLFMDRLSRAMERARRHPDTKAAVLFLDLDRFKNINDSLGHAQGDQLLVAVARRLAASLRPEDTISRFGGDEFGILLEDIRQASDATRSRPDSNRAGKTIRYAWAAHIHQFQYRYRLHLR
jgi:PAS domain S-box-containing protein